MSEEQTQPINEPTENTEVQEVQEVDNSDIPEYIPSKFWNTETKEVNVEDLGASYKALEKKLGMRTDELSKQIREDITNEISSAAPEEYQIQTPELPDGIAIDVDPEMPLLQWWAETARTKGLSQEEFDAGINAFVQNEVNALPNAQAEKEILGDNADARIQSADLWAKKNLSQEAYDTVANLAGTANGVRAIEEIMGLTKDAPIPNTETKIDVSPDPLDLKAMMKDPRYWKDGEKDAAYIKKVTDLYEKYYNQKSA